MLKEIGVKNIIMGIFVFGAILAFLTFSGLIKLGGDGNKVSGQVVVWGTIPYANMQKYIDQSKTSDIDILYKVQDEARYEDDLINAFASGTGPDLFIMPHEYILRNTDKIFQIPYTSFPKEAYQATYIDEAHIFLSKEGVYAIPMAVDPLVMYYNKNLLSSAFLLDIPHYWDEFGAFVSEVFVPGESGAVDIAAVALGSFDNVRNAKGILSTLLMQNGNVLVGRDPLSSKMVSSLVGDENTSRAAAQALRFYTSFSELGNNNYSWNEALPSSREKFISGELGIYFGKASELELIAKKNPNLNFDVALMPQINKLSKKMTYGALTGIAIAKQSKNIAAAIQVASRLSGRQASEGLTRELGLSPARKDLLKNKPEGKHENLFYKSAIIADAWVDSDPKATTRLFKNMIRSVNTGAMTPERALERASSEINVILNRTINRGIKDDSLE